MEYMPKVVMHPCDAWRNAYIYNLYTVPGHVTYYYSTANGGHAVTLKPGDTITFATGGAITVTYS